MTLKMIDGNLAVIVEQVGDGMSKGGLYMPNVATNAQILNGVVQVAADRRIVNGTVLDMSIKAGDKVWFQKVLSTEFDHQGIQYNIVNEANIIAVETQA